MLNYKHETVIDYAVKMRASSPADLLNMLQRRHTKCMAFDVKDAANCQALLGVIEVEDANTCHSLGLLEDKDSIRPVEQKNSESKKADKTFYFDDAKATRQQAGRISHFAPKHNVEIDRHGQAMAAVQLDDATSDIVYTLNEEQVKGFGSGTIVTPAFNAGRLSWHLVLDIDQQRNLSVWLMLRGSPLQSDVLQPVLNEHTPCFSSVIAHFQVTIESRVIRMPMFHSFAH